MQVHNHPPGQIKACIFPGGSLAYQPVSHYRYPGVPVYCTVLYTVTASAAIRILILNLSSYSSTFLSASITAITAALASDPKAAETTHVSQKHVEPSRGWHSRTVSAPHCRPPQPPVPPRPPNPPAPPGLPPPRPYPPRKSGTYRPEC